MVKKFEKIISSNFYNELFSSLNRFILSNRSKIKISKCCIDDISYITLDDFEIRRILSTKKVGCHLKSFLQVIAYVDVKGKNRNTYEVDSGEVWLHVSVTYELNDGIKNFIIREVNTTDEMQIPVSDFTANFVPIIESKRIAEISNDILFEYQPDVLLTPKPLDIQSLIEAVGVNLIEARLSHDQSIFGEIVFKETNIKVFNENGDPNFLKVDKGTIIVDPSIKDFRNQGSYNNTIVHEIVHWILHRNYQEYKMLTEDTASSSFVDTISGASTSWTDNDWMEWHANSIAPRLLMPRETTRKKVNELFTTYALKYPKSAKTNMFEQVIDDIAEFFQVSRFAAKIRLQQLGYREFEGIYNFVGNKYLRSYSFELKALAKNQTFTISFPNACLLNFQNEKFRELMDSNKYVYVDSHFCLNNSKFVNMVEFGVYEMTDYAYEHMDECCLVFDIYYKNDRKKDISITTFNEYIMYRGKAAVEIVVDFSEYLTIIGENVVIKDGEVFKELSSIMENLPGSFSKTLVYHRERKKISQEQLEEASNVSVATIRRLENNNLTNRSLENLMAISLGMKLYPDLSFDLIEKSGENFRNEVPTHTAYKMVLRTHYHLGAVKCNEILLEMNIPGFLKN